MSLRTETSRKKSQVSACRMSHVGIPHLVLGIVAGNIPSYIPVSYLYRLPLCIMLDTGRRREQRPIDRIQSGHEGIHRGIALLPAENPLIAVSSCHGIDQRFIYTALSDRINIIVGDAMFPAIHAQTRVPCSRGHHAGILCHHQLLYAGKFISVRRGYGQGHDGARLHQRSR